ncbi:MAG: serine acetyltransferase [Myxococcales bacterium]
MTRPARTSSVSARNAKVRKGASGPSVASPDMAGARDEVAPSAPAPAFLSAHLKLADQVLSAAAGMRKGLASEGPLPTSHDIRLLVEELVEVLFPESHRMAGNGGSLRHHVATNISQLQSRLRAAVFLGLHRRCRPGTSTPPDTCRRRANAITDRLLETLPEIRAELGRDVLAAFESDPAASGIDEIVACYPGLYAIAIYRVAHRLRRDGAEVVPRMLTEHAHSRTGIDINPGATVGHSFFIDHGTGIVVGETTVIGNRVRIYQGVTLGALSIRDRGRTDRPNPKKRHPTIEDDVIIYANATILGGTTVIGRGAVVGGNAWITYSVPPGIRVGVGT